MIPPAAQLALSLGIHRLEELSVVLRLAELIRQELDGIDRAHRAQDPPEDVHLLELVAWDEQLFLPRARPGDVNRREDALVRRLTIEHDLAVAGALELLENDFVHARSGIDECGRNDG